MISIIIEKLADAYSLVIFIYILMTWIPEKNGILGDIDDVLAKICDPYLDIFRKVIPPIGGMVDISPIFAIIVLELVSRTISGLL